MLYNKIFFTFIFIIISQNIFANDIFENLDEWNKWYKANETTLAGEMSCKITDQIIIKVKEGKPKNRLNHYLKVHLHSCRFRFRPQNRPKTIPKVKNCKNHKSRPL